MKTTEYQRCRRTWKGGHRWELREAEKKIEAIIREINNADNYGYSPQTAIDMLESFKLSMAAEHFRRQHDSHVHAYNLSKVIE